ncbi:D-alanine--D-alanine ligase family protein [Phenylobacterium deserti]|uniref:D-alanine--D-alanine ligase n=1 Tax=Phenylobacterium deserti TaxID=1914756 RepID=A0A328ANW3_9CAUL|nr:D-alanine--D-alanine ligase [Phenylobacterium deserti]RAK56693.1 D-alanine--D-alanine ligase [Phenylobacterium deserti]
MRITILFGGVSRERLVAVASTQALAGALPEADLWYWTAEGPVHAASREVLLNHQQPFEVTLPAEGEPLSETIEGALDLAAREGRLLVLGMHGGPAEDGTLAALCEARGVAFTGSGAAASRLAFDKAATKVVVAEGGVATPASIPVESGADVRSGKLAEELARHGRLVAKPVREGSSYGLIFVNGSADLEALAEAADREPYLVEPFVAGLESTCGVLENTDGTLIALPPVEIHPAEGAFDYASKYLSAETREICPATFPDDVQAKIKDGALKAHKAVGAMGYSRSDFIVTPSGPVFLEINTLPGLTQASLYPKALKAQGISFRDFLDIQIALAAARAGQS